MANKKKIKSLLTTESYMDFLKSLRFMGLGLDSSSVKVDRGILAVILSGEQTAETSFGAEYKILAQSPTNFIVGASFVLTKQTKKATEPVVLISVSYSALFETAQANDSQSVKRFSQSEAKLIFWPYLRYFISDMSSRMSIDQILLPLTSEFEARQAVAE